MRTVLNNFRPRELWIGPLPAVPSVQTLLDQAKKLGIQMIRRDQPRNNDSLVLHFSNGNSSCLAEGDAEKAIERRVADRYQPQADLLKHNGSLRSTTPELLASLRPRWAVISVGARNTFGHPRGETLKRLQEAGTATYRTDLNGAVTFYLAGSSVTPQFACLR